MNLKTFLEEPCVIGLLLTLPPYGVFFGWPGVFIQAVGLVIMFRCISKQIKGE